MLNQNFQRKETAGHQHSCETQGLWKCGVYKGLHSRGRTRRNASSLSHVSLAGRRHVTWFKRSEHRSLVQTETCRASSSTPGVPRTWMYRKALLRTLRFEVFLSSTLGMLRFNVSKHSFKCARLKKTQVVWSACGSTHQQPI